MGQRKDRLELVLEIKANETEAALLALNQARAQFLAGKERHEQLLIYREDYLQQLETMGEVGCTVSRMRTRLDFIAQLDTALSQMSQHLAQLAKIRSRAETHYLAVRATQSAVSQLMVRLEKSEQVKENKREQKESDEHAEKQWYSNRLNANSPNQCD